VNAIDKGVQGPNEVYPVVWTHEYGGRARVFGTSLGHANETWNTNQFKELMTRGFRWALKKDPIAMPPPARRGGGPARGAAPEAK
jgi:type 1 glutamine amidotransferase